MKLLLALIGIILGIPHTSDFHSFNDLREINSPQIKEIHSSDSPLRKATVRGVITLSSIAVTPQRTSRGAAYRNRGSAGTGKQTEASMQSILENTVISAYPTSYQIENLPTRNDVLIDQKDAEFIPFITPVTVGSTVQFVNSDSFFHNVFSLTPGAKFNIGRRPTGDVYEKRVPPVKYFIEGIGPIDIFCDIHTQMNAVILSLETPYFTKANADGSFELTGLPAGTYEITVYNKTFDAQKKELTIDENGSYSMDFNI